MININYQNIIVNRDEISQEKLNITNRTRTNLFAWNGQFSPQFIETMLDKYAKEGFYVLDPFAGSGTTLIECARKDISAYGIELNVAPYYMAKIYELVNISIEKRKLLIKKVSEFISFQDNDEQILENILSEINCSDDKEHKDILSTLIILLDVFKNDMSIDLLNKKWDKLFNIIDELPFTKSIIKVDRGDSRNIPIKDNQFDLLLTSPPYINVFNYHQKYRKSVETLGFDVLKIAKTEFGSNRKNRGNRLLTSIQYCIDMALSMNEAIRVCKNNSRMIYVVGRESSVLGYSLCNSELIYNIGTQIFGLNFDLKQERVFKNRFGKMIYEDILHFINNNNFIEDETIVIEQARIIAKNYLINLLKTSVHENNKDKLEDAIARADTVKKSEELL